MHDLHVKRATRTARPHDILVSLPRELDGIYPSGLHPVQVVLEHCHRVYKVDIDVKWIAMRFSIPGQGQRLEDILARIHPVKSVCGVVDSNWPDALQILHQGFSGFT